MQQAFRGVWGRNKKVFRPATLPRPNVMQVTPTRIEPRLRARTGHTLHVARVSSSTVKYRASAARDPAEETRVTQDAEAPALRIRN
jgi:hypothetical protein